MGELTLRYGCVTEWEKEMQAVPQTWETEFHTSSSRLQREQQHTWSQRSVVLDGWSVNKHVCFICASLFLLISILMMVPDSSTCCCRTRSMCWRTPFPLTHSTTWSSSCPSPCWEYLSPSWERAKQRVSCSVSLHTHTIVLLLQLTVAYPHSLFVY